MGMYRGWQRPSLITGPSVRDAPSPATAPNGTEHRAVAGLRATVGRQPWLAYATEPLRAGGHGVQPVRNGVTGGGAEVDVQGGAGPAERNLDARP